MSDAFDRLFSHVSKTIQAPPTGTLTAYPRLNGNRFTDVDSGGGVRGELEEYLGQSRVFELALDAVSISPLRMGGPVTTAYALAFPVRVRYDAPNSSESRTILREITEDITAIIDAIERSQWYTVSGLATLQATPGNITRFTLSDEADNTHTGYIGAVQVTASIDI